MMLLNGEEEHEQARKANFNNLCITVLFYSQSAALADQNKHMVKKKKKRETEKHLHYKDRQKWNNLKINFMYVQVK